MYESQSNPSNVLLVLMFLDRNDSNPSRPRRGQLEKGGVHLLAGVLDPAHRAASAPVTGINLDGDKLETYNRVLAQFQGISERFYREGGFIDRPESYTDDCQGAVLDDISNIGRDIYDLFKGSPIRRWLDELFESNNTSRARPVQPVTILTNDFSIPWFWLKGTATSTAPFLCEVCSLGLMQLSAESHHPPPGREDKKYEALLIKDPGSPRSVDEELEAITSLLQDSFKRPVRAFKAKRADSFEHITSLWRSPEDQLRTNFRIVHFSGHYSSTDLLLGGEPIARAPLNPVLDGSVAVLDGCSIGRGLQAWADVEGITSSLMAKDRALGCVVTILPVKHDPIARRILWETFYRALRDSTSTVGQALATARIALHEHFKAIGSRNPMWAAYQLIGSPAVQLCHEDEIK